MPVETVYKVLHRSAYNGDLMSVFATGDWATVYPRVKLLFQARKEAGSSRSDTSLPHMVSRVQER
jgi:hypothetical protein